MNCNVISLLLLLLLFPHETPCFKTKSLLVRGGGIPSSLSFIHDSTVKTTQPIAPASIQPPHPTKQLNEDELPIEGSTHKIDYGVRTSLESVLSVFQNAMAMMSPRVIAIVDWNQPENGGVLHIDRDCAMFYPQRWKRSRGLPLLHTLALVCDGIILRLDNEAAAAATNGPSSLVALVDGLMQRSKVTKSRGSLLLMLRDDDYAPDLMVALRSMDFDGIFEEDIQSFDIVSENDASRVKHTLEDWSLELAEGSFTVDKDTLLPLILRVYRKLGGQEDALLVDGIHLKDAVATTPRGGSDAPTSTNVVATNAFRSHGQDDMVLRALDDLQNLLLTNALDEAAMPVQFGKHAEKVFAQINGVEKNHRAELQERLRCLHELHLQTLRDYFGRMYETMLDRSNGTPNAISTLQEKTLRSFRRSARDSIPSNKPVELDLSYTDALDGLSRDMKDFAYIRRDIAEELVVEEDKDGVSARRWNPPRWLKSLAARAIMLGVNYVQGWLALQGIRQAALERERNMPKIPLF